MKIVYIIKSLAMMAGVERVMSDKMNFLASQGYEVTLITYEQGAHPLSFSLNSTIRHYDLDVRFFKLSQYSLPVRLFKFHQLRRQFKERLQQIVNEIQPDIFIATTYSLKVIDLILGIQTHAKRILESHVACYMETKSYNYRHNPLLYRIAKVYDNRLFRQIRQFDKLVVLTHGDSEDWKRYISDVEVIPNPVTFFPETIQEHRADGKRIICVGRLHEQKGFDLLIQAFAKVADSCPGWHIDIFGSGDDHDMLTAMIDKLGLSDRVKILPPTKQIYEEYQKSDFYVLSSRYEGYALVLNEAMSCGLPCVAFLCKYGPEEAINDRKSGLTVKNGDIDELGKKIQWMATHDQERLAMGRQARIDAQRYKKEVIMKRWMVLFDRLQKGERYELV